MALFAVDLAVDKGNVDLELLRVVPLVELDVQPAHEHEDIRAFVAPVDAVLERLAKGEYNNASTVMALQWLALNRERLKKKWS